jgi:Glycosyltransferase family 87
VVEIWFAIQARLELHLLIFFMEKVYILQNFTYLVIIGLFIWLALPKRDDRFVSWKTWLACGLLVGAIVPFVWSITYPGNLFSDFNKAYYPAGKIILENPIDLYNWPTYTSKGAKGFVNLPILALLFTPLSYLDKPIAQGIFLALGIVASLGCYYWLIRLTQATVAQSVLLFLLFVASGPLYNSLRYGNTTHFILLGLVGIIYSLRQRRDFLIGSILALIALIKLPLLLLGVYFAFRQRWRVVTGLVATLVLVTGLSCVLFGPALNLEWFRECIVEYVGKPLGAFNVQSIDGFLVRLLTNADLRSWQPVEMGLGYKLLRYSAILAMVATTVWVFGLKMPQTDQAFELEFATVVGVGVLISPVSWTHYYLLLLLPIAYLVTGQMGHIKALLNSLPYQQYIGILALVLVSLPVLSFQPTRPIVVLFWSKFWVSHYFYGGLLLWGLMLVQQYQARSLTLTNHSTYHSLNL